MGGYRSTRWRKHEKKTTMDDCLSLDVNDFVPCMGNRADTIQSFWCNGDIEHQVYFEFFNPGDYPVLILENLTDRDDPLEGDQTITFVSTPGTYGGLRWWFRCPACERRVRKLYLPPTARHFACRHCHDLTYTSAQTAHRYDRRKDEIGSIEEIIALMARAEKAWARYQCYQRSCKGKMNAIIEYLYFVQEIERVFRTFDTG